MRVPVPAASLLGSLGTINVVSKLFVTAAGGRLGSGSIERAISGVAELRSLERSAESDGAKSLHCFPVSSALPRNSFSISTVFS